MLTMKTRYALKALIVLARHSDEPYLLTADIARAQGIPQRFLEGILLELKRHGLLYSRRGRGGGYSLRREPSTITVDAVLCALERPIDLEPCNAGFNRNQCGDCTNYESCGVHAVLVRVCDAIRTALRETTIAELAGVHDSKTRDTKSRAIELDASGPAIAP
jgi:Rrf2 family protein